SVQKVPETPVTKVEIHGVGRAELLHEARQISLRRLQYEVVVVAHQTKQIQPHIELLHTRLQSPNEPAVVPRIPKQEQALILPAPNHPTGDVINRSRIFYAQRTRHNGNNPPERR